MHCEALTDLIHHRPWEADLRLKNFKQKQAQLTNSRIAWLYLHRGSGVLYVFSVARLHRHRRLG